MADEVVKIIKIEAEGSEQTVKDLRQEISGLRDNLLNVQRGSEEYNAILEKLTSKQEKLKDVMTAGKETFQNSRQELRNLKNELDKLQEGTDEYNAAFQRAADITHTLSERQQMLKYSAADMGTQLQNVVAIGGSLAAGFNSVNAIMTLTGSKSEDLQKAMVKLQAGIALVQGLQGLEGMGKRMKGVVNGLTEFIFGTNKATAAVKTEQTAVNGLTTAQEANATATKAATVATNTFKKALVATGIGAIIVLIGTLVSHWEDFKNMVGLSNEKLEQFAGLMDRIKVVVGGVANVILNLFVAAVKNAIEVVTTLGEVTYDVLTFQFGKAAKAVKDGVKNIAENSKKGWDIVNNYQEGAAKAQNKILQAQIEKNLKAREKELEDTIKDNEAKYGSDWKYTEEAKKLYDELFDTRLKRLKEGTDEYKEALRERWAYDREYTKHNEKETEKISQNKIKANKEVIDKQAEQDEKRIKDIQKRAEDSQKTELQLLEDKYKEELALFEQYQKDTTDLTKEYEAKRKNIIDKQDTERKQKRQNEILDNSANNIRKSDERNVQEVTAIELEYSLKEADGSFTFNDIIDQINRIYEVNKQHLQEQIDEYESLKDNPELDDAARLEAEENYYNALEEMRYIDLKHQEDTNKAKKRIIQEQIKMYSDLANSIGSIFGNIADIMQEDIERKVENGDITEKEAERQFRQVKAFQIAQATINTISGAIAAFMSCQSTYPQPYGTIIGAIQAAAVTTAGIAQIQKIKNTQLNSGGGGTDVSTTMQASAVQPEPQEYSPQYYRNATGESEITQLTDSIRDQRVILVESDVDEALEKSKRVKVESTW